MPQVWKLKTGKDCAKQFKIIKELVAKADEIVHAGDPDREGQLLVDEVLEQVGNRKPVKRILLNALDEKSVAEALHDLRDNKDFSGLKNSALGRSRADWLVGMNLTRAYTDKARKAGYDSVLKVGRVKTPTMALIVRRETEIQNFKPVNYFTVQATFHSNLGNIPAAWQMPEDLTGLDSDGRLVDRAVADNLLKKFADLPKETQGRISSVRETKKQDGQRLPYSLSVLQIEAGRLYGYSPQDVLKTMQALYEQKLTSYPRSDCDYLPENQLMEAEKILSHLGEIEGDIGVWAKNADASIRSRAWNDKKMSAHHAIIPTRIKADLSALTDMQKQLYFLVAKAYIAQFYPVHIYLATQIEIEFAGEKFVATGRTVTEPGWKSLYQDSKE